MSLVDLISKMESGLSFFKLQCSNLINIEKNFNQTIIYNYNHVQNSKIEQNTMVFCPNNKSERHSDNSLDAINSKTLTLNISSDDSLNESTKIQSTMLPFTTGVYLQFTDSNWCKSAPPYIDITNSFRIVTLTKNSTRFPSIEEVKRIIKVEMKKNKLNITRDWDSMEFRFSYDANNKRPLRFRKNGCYWSLSYIAPERPRKLKFKSNCFVLEYKRSVFKLLLCLVNHHKTRGDEIYIIIYPGDFS